MDNSFFAYLHRLELMAFFSGYPLIYSVILFMAGNQRSKNNFRSRLVSLLPFAYALVGTCYLGLQLKYLYFGYSIKNTTFAFQQPYLITWGLLSILFWIPALSKKKILSLLHSLVFFFFLVSDLFSQLSARTNNDNVKNDMRIYTLSLIINFAALIFMALLSFLYARYKKSFRS